MTQILAFLHEDIASQLPNGLFDGKIALITPPECMRVARRLIDGIEDPDSTMSVADAMKGKEDSRGILLDLEGQRSWTNDESEMMVDAFASAFHPMPVGIYRMKYHIPSGARLVNPDWYPKYRNGNRQRRNEYARAINYSGQCEVVPATSPDFTERGRAPEAAHPDEIKDICAMARTVNSIAVWARRDSDPERIKAFVEQVRSA